jgi:hypothetical protein
VKERLFRLPGRQVASAKGTKVDSRCLAAHQQGHAFPLGCYFGADGAARASAGLLRMEEACPLAKPLIKSLHSTLGHWVAIVAADEPKSQ